MQKGNFSERNIPQSCISIFCSLNKLKKEIVALGHINERAIEDCKNLEERFGKMYNQSQDLIKAESDLKRIIKDLSNEMIVRFQTEFDKINTNFGIVFKELFGGGSAHLEILDSEDALEAGIEIKAEPPEKKLSNISLLSGGEQALVAIAILFAIILFISIIIFPFSICTKIIITYLKPINITSIFIIMLAIFTINDFYKRAIFRSFGFSTINIFQID